MTTDQFIQKLDNQLALIIKEDKPLFLGVKSIMAIQSKRIWIDGKNKDGSNIGSYKGGEIYVSPKGLRKKPALKGKGGKTTFKDGSIHKTGYFVNYLAFKKSIGRNQHGDTVDLLLNGDLQQDWANGELSKASAVKVNAHNYYVSLDKTSVDKVSKYNEGNKVFGLSIVEKGKFLFIVQQELAKELRGNA